MELLAILVVIAAGIAALVGVRIYVDRQDVAYTDPADGVSLRTDPPRSAKAPFYRFSEFSMLMPFDVQRLQDEGFDVTHFQVATGYNSPVN
nr:hypothetical protein [Vicinamibacterales bacterium]